MDYRDTQEYYTKRQKRTAVRSTRKLHSTANVKSVVMTTIALVVAFLIVTLMIGQLASCSPAQLTQENVVAVRTWQLNNMEFKTTETRSGELIFTSGYISDVEEVVEE